MKRWSQAHVAQIAREFANSQEANSWYMFGPGIRRAILDQVVMDALRMADVADSTIQLTAAEIVEFRKNLEGTLAKGVKAHSRAMMRSFVVNE